MKFECIVASPEILNGKPIIKNTRISVEMILEWFASGASMEEIESQYPQLSRVALQEALLYASKFMQNETDILIEKVG